MVTPTSLNKRLLKKAELYCIIDVTPNTGFNDTTPKNILKSLIILVNGK